MLRALPSILAVATFQSPPATQLVVELRPANGVLTEEFIELIGLRELRDGKPLLTDRHDNRLLVADFRADQVTEIGSRGAGPSEFRGVDQLLALGADSTLMRDAGNGRWLLLEGAAIVATLPMTSTGYPPLHGPLLGTSGDGGFLSRIVDGGLTLGSRLVGDSGYLIRSIRGTAGVDTIARVSLDYPKDHLTTGDGIVGRGSVGEPPRVRPIWVPISDDAVLFSDGWVAIVRADPYRVEWRKPGGESVLGPPLVSARRRWTDGNRRAYLSRESRINGTPAESPEMYGGWPRWLPPFVRTFPSVFASPDGRVLILRTVDNERPGMWYDVVARDGHRTQLKLAENQHILGFGRSSVYVVTVDDDGVQYLARHPWNEER